MFMFELETDLSPPQKYYTCMNMLSCADKQCVSECAPYKLCLASEWCRILY